MRWTLDQLPPTRWLVALAPLVAAFFYVPLAFGGTTPESVRVLDWLLLHGFLLWVCVLVLERRLPRLPLALWIPLLVLLVLGAFQWWNAKAVTDQTFGEIRPIEGALTFLPGTISANATRPILVNLGALALGGLVLQDALAGTRVRWLLFRVIALAGFVIALIGIYQKASHAEAMLWSEVRPFEGTKFFAAYRYHGNAASFLNLSWPAALAVYLRSRLLRPGSIVASLDFCVFFLLAAAVFVNSSKAGQILGLVGVVLAAWRFRAEFLTNAGTNRVGMLVLALFLIVLGGVFVMPGLLNVIANWNAFAENPGSLTGRLLAYGASMGAIADHGLWGTGAGTFRFIFPYYTLELEDRIVGYWHYAHSDWIQTIIEWGWFGFLAWATVIGGAFVRLWKRCRDASRKERTELSCSVALLALFLVLLHAVADFPLQIPSLQWLFVFYLALGWSRPHVHHGHGHHEHHEHDHHDPGDHHDPRGLHA
ncbi:MAG: O-antigen ligase family protein [Verrucomicrobiales bacterium]|nr:O-antigen ligase family protein [Verrucomicrobiales bacterium]